MSHAESSRSHALTIQKGVLFIKSLCDVLVACLRHCQPPVSGPERGACCRRVECHGGLFRVHSKGFEHLGEHMAGTRRLGLPTAGMQRATIHPRA